MTYLNAIEPEINLVLSPVHVASRYDERSSHFLGMDSPTCNICFLNNANFLATIPTFGDALEALNSLCQDLSTTLKQISDISAELSTKELIAVDNIQEVRTTALGRPFILLLMLL